MQTSVRAHRAAALLFLLYLDGFPGSVFTSLGDKHKCDSAAKLGTGGTRPAGFGVREVEENWVEAGRPEPCPQGRVAWAFQIQDSRVQTPTLPHTSSLAPGTWLNLPASVSPSVNWAVTLPQAAESLDAKPQKGFNKCQLS